VGTKAAPGPLLWRLNQTAPDRITMNVAQLVLAPNIEVVKAALPDMSMLSLFLLSAVSSIEHTPRKADLQGLHHDLSGSP